MKRIVLLCVCCIVLFPITSLAQPVDTVHTYFTHEGVYKDTGEYIVSVYITATFDPWYEQEGVRLVKGSDKKTYDQGTYTITAIYLIQPTCTSFLGIRRYTTYTPIYTVHCTHSPFVRKGE